MITKKDFCEAILKEYINEEMGLKDNSDLSIISELAIYNSSKVAIAMEYLGLLKEEANINYAQSRSGNFIIHLDGHSRPTVITYRDILDSLPK